MKNPWNFVTELFNDEIKPVSRVDNTVYQVETIIGKYCGQIIYQDEVCMRLRHSKEKPVKILKTNISRIYIAKPAAVEQYQNLLN
jgi:hypothetical protein